MFYINAVNHFSTIACSVNNWFTWQGSQLCSTSSWKNALEWPIKFEHTGIPISQVLSIKGVTAKIKNESASKQQLQGINSEKIQQLIEIGSVMEKTEKLMIEIDGLLNEFIRKSISFPLSCADVSTVEEAHARKVLERLDILQKYRNANSIVLTYIAVKGPAFMEKYNEMHEALSAISKEKTKKGFFSNKQSNSYKLKDILADSNAFLAKFNEIKGDLINYNKICKNFAFFWMKCCVQPASNQIGH